MIDGGFLKKKFKTTFRKHIVSEDVVTVAQKILKSLSLECGSYRIYYYDCPPSNEEVVLPISKTKYSFSSSKGYNYMAQLLKDLKRKDFFAVREGILSFKGWTLKKSCYSKSGEFTVPKLNDDCFSPSLQQKGVDTKIGLDIAWASYEKIAKIIVLVTGDSDFAPAMKTARRNGIFVYLYTLGHGVMSPILENADVLNTENIKTFI